MRRTQVLATDVDFTLTDARLRLNTEAVEEIRQLERKRVKVILISGRNLPSIGSLAQLIGTSGLVVGENGGVIARYQTPIKILSRIENARAALRILKKRMGRRIKERADSRYGMRLSSVSLERSFEPEEARRILQKSRLRVDLTDTGVSFQLLDSHVSKGYALAQLARLKRLSLANAVAIGDNYNDLSLFEAVAYRIAVANAPEGVKERADYACRHRYGRGFLEAVAHLGL
ncbi:MAG: phosphoglycolate phosphatase [Candidatus Bathyarchaeia archaeon]